MSITCYDCDKPLSEGEWVYEGWIVDETEFDGDILAALIDGDGIPMLTVAICEACGAGHPENPLHSGREA